MLSWQHRFCMLSIGTRLRGYDGLWGGGWIWRDFPYFAMKKNAGAKAGVVD